MDTLSSIISFLIYLLVACPVCLILHEFGHASMILLLTKQKVTVQFGVQGTKREIHWGRLTILLYFEPSALFFGRYLFENYAAVSRQQLFWITVGGPLVSLLLTILCGALWFATNTVDPWRGLAVINLICVLNPIIPWHHSRWMGVMAGLPSDGLQLVQLFQEAKDRNGVSRR
jgi:Zn-dependent protease